MTRTSTGHPLMPDFSNVLDNRRRNLRAVRAKDTRPEMLVRQALHRLGYRYRLHAKDLPGRPALVFTSRRIVVEVRGCFWHQHTECRRASLPKERAQWWAAKLTRNVERDQENEVALEAAGWCVVVVWECDLRQDPSEAIARLKLSLGPPGHRNTTGNST